MKWNYGYDHGQQLGAATAANRNQVASVRRSSSSETNIAMLNVHTQATDAHGIARDIKKELRRYDYVTQADPGLA